MGSQDHGRDEYKWEGDHQAEAFEPQTRVPTLEVLTGKMSTQNIQN